MRGVFSEGPFSRRRSIFSRDMAWQDLSPPDPIIEAFAVELMPDGRLEIVGNDGREFSVASDDPRFDGTHSADPTELDAGPIVKVGVALIDDGTPAVGETLIIGPPMVAYDPALGEPQITYLSDGENEVVASDPTVNPTLLIAAADAGQALTVTARVTQGDVTIDVVSNAVSIPASGLPIVQFTGAAQMRFANEETSLSEEAFFTFGIFFFDAINENVNFAVGPAAAPFLNAGTRRAIMQGRGGNADMRMFRYNSDFNAGDQVAFVSMIDYAQNRAETVIQVNGEAPFVPHVYPSLTGNGWDGATLHDGTEFDNLTIAQGGATSTMRMARSGGYLGATPGISDLLASGIIRSLIATDGSPIDPTAMAGNFPTQPQIDGWGGLTSIQNGTWNKGSFEDPANLTSAAEITNAGILS